jgi:hypothetical protein
MTRFAWLQSRTKTLFTAALVAALAISGAITGVHYSHLSHSLIGQCQTSCDLATAEFLSHGHFMQHVFDLVSLLVPAVFGIFWGAPLLAHELETGTHRLAWTQSVTRSRWLVTRLAVIGLATAVLAGVLTLTITWWYRAFDVLDTSTYSVFERRDIAPIGYAVFAFAAGALVGAVARRTLPAMVATLGVYVLVRVTVQLWVRPHLLAPLHKTASLLTGGMGFDVRNGDIRLVLKEPGPANSWTVSSHLANAAGRVPTASQITAYVRQHCPTIGVPAPGGKSIGEAGTPPNPGTFHACQVQLAQTYHLVASYQPASRYWTFQWLETGIFAGLALLAAAGCYWVVTRRLA